MGEACLPSPYAILINGRVLFDPHPGKQLAAMRRMGDRVLGTAPCPSKLFLYGNRGGGKSVTVRKTLHAFAMAKPGLKYAVVRRNMPDLRSNHLIYLGSEMRTLGGSFHETYGQTMYANGSIGFFRQCEDEKDVEKIVGAEVAILFVDEAPQIRWDFLRMMSPSLRVPRGADGSQPYRTLEVYSGNPAGESVEELWQYFVDKDVDPVSDPEYDPAEFEAIEVRLSDNPSLDPVEYQKQFAGLPAHIRLAWKDGVRMESRTLFDVVKTKGGKPYHYLQELPTIDGTPLLQLPWIQVYRAFDMGYFPDPAFCLWLAVVGRRVIAIQEHTWFRTIAKDLAHAMQELTRELLGDIPVAMTYVDPVINLRTGSDTVTVMDTLEMAGVPCEASINDRVLYADAIHGLLGEEVEPGVPRFQIYEPGCPMLARYLPKMRWEEGHPRKMAQHKFDHAVVSLAYFAISSGVLSWSAAETAATRPVWMDWVEESKSRQKRRGSWRGAIH